MAIGSVSVDVVPDATNFWRRFEAQTRSGTHDVDVRVNADTAAARAQIDSLGKSSTKASSEMHLLRDAAVLLGPSIVPVAAVATGALIGLVPVLASVGLGVAGIVKDFKSGQLAGTQFGHDINQLGNEFSRLEQISAGGLLTGLDTAMTSLRPAFADVNRETALMSQQFGQIAGHVIPGFVSLLTKLNPLFVTFGNELIKGAASFQHWAASSDSVSKFVSYVQQELPTVEHALGQVVELAGRLVAGLAPIGHVALSSIGLLAQLLNALPLDVLSKIESGAIAVYAAFRTYSAITGIVNGVNVALAAFAARHAATAAVAQASALQVEAASAQEAATVAASQSEMAAAAAEAAVAIAAATEGTSSVLAAGAAAAAEAAIEESAAFASAAEAAAASAAGIAAAAEAAAAASAAAGEGAAIGWAAMLGPIGALVVGLGVLGFAMSSTTDDTQDATNAMNSYADSVKTSTDALNRANVAQTIKNLSDAHALTALNQLHSQNIALGVSFQDLATAVNGPKKGFDQLYDSLKKTFQSDAIQNGPDKARNSLYDLLKALDDNRSGLFKQIAVQKAYNAALRENRQAIDGGSSAAARQAHALGLTKTAYLDAQTAARKNTQQTKAQTVAWQLANAAGSLLQATLDKLSGKRQSFAEANNAFQQQLVTLAQNLKQGGNSIKGLSSDAIANRGDLLALVQGAQQTAEAFGQMTGSSEKARQKLIGLRDQIIANAVAHGENKKAVTDYIDSLLKIPKTVPPTKLDADAAPAKVTIADLREQINAIKQDHSPLIRANPDIAAAQIREIQRKIDALHGKTIEIGTHYTTPGSGPAKASPNATGGPIYGPGSGTSDSIPAWLSNGEFVINARQAAKHRALLDAINRGVQGFGGGGVVTLSPSPKTGTGSTGSGSTSSGTSSSSTAAAHLTFIVDGHRYDSLQAAKNAALSLLRGNIKLGVTIEGTGFRDWKKAVDGTVAQANTAFRTVLTDLNKLGISENLAKSLKDENAKLDSIVHARDVIRKKLGEPPAPPTAYDRLATALGNLKQEAQTVRAAIRGSFDISSAGTGFDGQQPITGQNILAQQKQAAFKARKFVQDLKKLQGKVGRDYLTTLAEKGPDALPEAEALLTLSIPQLRQLGSTGQALDQQSNILAKFISKMDFGTQVTNARADIHNLRDRLHDDNTRIENRLKNLEDRIANSVDHLAHRPVNIYLDGKKVASSVNTHNSRDVLARG